ncbi:PREDICTED: uncharacterized protein LOC102013922 isoform X2 [Chinchilla lanigera]|uniref:uncharacterized protein LOC102013922 isoform X2 n=1 Tax=Chinchilla lanigera TaxID=34839 RepID=UPI00038EBBA3|nr:PREDICTED: uncharacterized protein LOC102013922 isoform X2 [Chinchilla lanigera]
MEVLGIPAASALLPQHINQPEPCRCALQTLCHLLPVQNTGRRLACLGSGWPCSADARDNARQLFSSALPSTGIRGLARPFCLRLKMRICGLKWRPASLAAGSADRTIWRPSEELPGPGCSAQAGLHAALSSQPDEGGTVNCGFIRGLIHGGVQRPHDQSLSESLLCEHRRIWGDTPDLKHRITSFDLALTLPGRGLSSPYLCSRENSDSPVQIQGLLDQP